MKVPMFLARRRFSILLGSLVLILVFEPAAFGLAIRSWIFDLFFSITLISAVFALTPKRRFQNFVVAFGGLTLLATWLVHALPNDWYLATQAISHSLAFCFMVYVAGATVYGVFSSSTIDLESVFGCIAGYLLLGTAWGALYSTLQLFSADCFDLGMAFSTLLETETQARLPLFIYYSFVTLTTLGYGDMTPITQMARTLSWLEAVVGQFYIATLVAGTVSVFTTRAMRRRGYDEMSTEERVPRKPKKPDQH